ncbi:MAG: phosphoribosyltransferase family protein, partial [Bacteroidota bacterium]
MEPLLILNHQQIQQKINRMAYQIFENNFAESDIVLAGIEQRGFILAQRIEAALKKFSSQNIILL